MKIRRRRKKGLEEEEEKVDEKRKKLLVMDIEFTFITISAASGVLSCRLVLNRR